MATAQRTRNQTQSGTWESIFPNDQCTESQSALFMKKMLAVAVSSITYLRALFPESAYGDRKLEDINLKILKDDVNWPDACQIIQWLRGCFDALEKKYLRGVLVGIYDDPEDADTVIEQYTFRFSYGDGNGMDLYRNGVKLLSSTDDKETKKATIRLLRTIIVLTQTLSPLPDDVYMTMKLVYYDEVTPEDYDPPGFKSSASDEFSFKEEPINIKVGDVTTNYHSFKLRVSTLHHDLQENSQKAICDSMQRKLSNGFGIMEDAIVPDVLTNKDESIDIPSEEKENIDPQKTKSGQIPFDEAPVRSVEDDIVIPNTLESEESKTLCPCGLTEDDGLMILCAGCNTWQHATCFGILDSKDAPVTHFCIDCAKVNDYICTDKELSHIEDPIRIREICIWRRALITCSELSKVVPAVLSKSLGVPVAMASALIKRLENEGFVKSGGKGKRSGKIVQKDEILGRGIEEYFQSRKSDEYDDLSLVEKTSNMEISEDGRETDSQVDEQSKRKSREVLTFDISNSQINSPKRRKKASISADPMSV